METKTKATLVVVSKDDQKVIASDIFKNYPKANKVAVASDGQAFITDNGENAAKSHAKNNRYGKELELTPFNRDENSQEGDKNAAKKAVEVIALIEAAKTVDEVNALIEGDVRATVVAAAKKMIETLNTPA